MLKTEVLSAINVSDAEYKRIIEKAAETVKRGSVAALPTETVYGLFANALSGEAVRKIFDAKGRPQDNPLIVHIADFEDVYKLSDDVPIEAKLLAEKFCPGPFTMILKSNGKVAKEVSAGLSTVAIRMPDSKIALDVIRESKLPLAAPSANISGFPSPTSAEHVIDDMTGRIELIIDGGNCRFGVESTVLSLTGDVPKILRPGAVTAEDIKSVVGAVEIDESVLKPLAEDAKVSSPGMKYRHYSPKAQVIVLKGSFKEYLDYINNERKDGDFALCFDGEEDKLPINAVSYGAENDSLAQAQRLYGALRQLDDMGAKRVFARCPSKEGVGLAVCNRLFRAAGFNVVDLEKALQAGFLWQR